MAELHIERKDRTIWPWVLAGLALLALLLWFLFGRTTEPEVGVADTTAPGVVTDTAAMGAAQPAAVTEFVQFAQAAPAGDAGVAHDYTADGLRRLAGALDAVVTRDAVSGVDVQERVSGIRAKADSIQADPTATTHARQTREAALLAAGLMRQVQEAGYVNAAEQVNQVDEAARAIPGDGMLTDLTSQVRSFFERSATALQAMSTRS